MNKKEKLVIIIIIAVVLYFLWKKNKSSITSLDNEVTSYNNLDFDYIMSHVTFTNSERQYIADYKNQVENSTLQTQSIQAKAYKNGLSFEQQLVLDAIYIMYKKGSMTETRRTQLQQDIKSL